MYIDEIRTKAQNGHYATKKSFSVPGASSKEEFKVNCTNRGADCYLEKTVGWQQELLQACIA